GHAAELFNSPRVAPRLARGEVALLSLEEVLEQIHDCTSMTLTHPAGGLSSRDALAKFEFTQIDGDDQRIRNGRCILATPQHSALGRYENSRELLMPSHVLRGSNSTGNFRVIVVALK